MATGSRMIFVRCKSGCENLLPSGIVQTLQDVMEHGAAKGLTGWENIDKFKHIDRAIIHLENSIEEDKTEDRLDHAFCRIMMALAIDRGYVKAGEDG